MYPVLFYLFAAAATGFGLNLVLQRHPLYSALSLIGVMASLASLYLLLGAEFIAAVQMILFAGAIMTLFLFVILPLPLLHGGEEAGWRRSRMVKHLGAPLLIVLLSLLATVIDRQFPPDSMVRFGTFPGRTADIGRQIFLYYILPFEAVSILILVAALGAVVLAGKSASKSD